MTTKFLLTGLLCTALFVPAAHAGFQWTAPSNVPAAASRTGSAMPHVPAAPVAPVVSEGLASDGMVSAGAIPTTPDGPATAAPIYGQGPNGPMTDDPITWNAPAAAPRAPVSIMPAPATQVPVPVTAAAVMATPLAPAPQPAAMIASAATVTSAPMAVAPTPVGYGAYENAEGFGNDLPLVMAIRQVVPASYGFVFDDGINLSTNVSWQGGRPWNLVLNDILSPLGLRAQINAKVVSILPANAGFQQVSTTGPMVSSDIMNTRASATAIAPAIAPAITYSAPVVAPAVIQGQAFAATPVAAGRMDLGATTTWTAPRNSTLRNILEDWSKRVGVELYWASEYDYPVQSAVSINGSFEEAVQTLLKGLNESKPRPLGRLHPNLPNGPAVLVIETRQSSM